MKLFNLFKTFSLLSVLSLLTSCSKDEMESGLLIRLSGSMGSVQASASTRNVVDEAYYVANDLPVRFLRIDQAANGSWAAFSTVNAPLEATRTKGKGDKSISFAASQFYQNSLTNNSTKLVGWYPAGTYAAGKVTFDISKGTTDVMLTDELSGSKSSPFGSFTFSHQLTQIIVKAYPSGDLTAAGWENVTSVKVKEQPTGCVLSLDDRSLTWSGSASLVLKQISNDADMTAVALKGATQASPVICGYALLKPTDSKTLTLEVTTGKGDVRDVTVTLPTDADPQKFAAGKAYIITLEFKSITINPTAGVTDWVAGGSVNVVL